MFTERKIAAFQQKVAELPDVPNLSAAALKARFDACPEELRQALNGVCDDGKALEERIDAYRAQTFTGEVTETMLDSALAGKLNGKAEQSALKAVEEATADSLAEMQTALSQTDTKLAAKCEVVFGSYTGDGTTSRYIDLGFAPAALLISDETGFFVNGSHQSYGGMCLLEQPNTAVRINGNGFYIYGAYANLSGKKYYYIAFKA